MPDERQDSIRQGIAVPPDSPTGAAAAEERRERAAQGPPIGGAMGGTSDASRPGDEAQMNAARQASEAAGTGGEGGELPGNAAGAEGAQESGEEPDPAEMYRDIPGDRVGG